MKSPFKGTRDTTFKIYDMLSDEDLLNKCIAFGKDPDVRKICNDEEFWKRRFIKNFGNVEKREGRTWKNFYLGVLYYSKYNINKALEEASKGGMKNIDLINYFISKGAWVWAFGMFGAAKGGDQNLVNFFIRKMKHPEVHFDSGMRNAAQGGHQNLVNFFIDKGAKNWDEGMYGAAQGGHLNLVKFFIDKGARIWNLGMYGSALGGHKDLVDLFIQKGANNFDSGLANAAQGGHRDLVEFFINEKGAKDFKRGLRNALEKGDQDLAEFFKQRMNEKQ